MIININSKANNPYLIDDYTKSYLRWYLIIIFSTFRCLLIASSPCPLLPGER
jgi:cytochrome c oxidase subunit IV